MSHQAVGFPEGAAPRSDTGLLERALPVLRAPRAATSPDTRSAAVSADARSSDAVSDTRRVHRQPHAPCYLPVREAA